MAKKLSTSFSINDLTKIKSLSEESFKIFEKESSTKLNIDKVLNIDIESNKLITMPKNTLIIQEMGTIKNEKITTENRICDLNDKNSTVIKRLSSKYQLLRRHSSFVKKRMREMKVFQLENINQNNLFKIIACDLNKEKKLKENIFYFITHNHLLLIQWFVSTSSKCKYFFHFITFYT